MNYRIITFVLTLLSGTALSAAPHPFPTDSVAVIIQQFKTKYAPDKRTAIFNLSAKETNGAYIIKGETNQPQGKRQLINTLKAQGVSLQDSIRLLPDTALHHKTYGLVNLSVICMRSGPDYMDGLDTQTLLGSPVRIMEKKHWWHIQSSDDYLGWTHYSSIVPLTKKELELWNRSTKVIVTATQSYGYTKSDRRSQIVSDLIAGDRLRLIKRQGNFYKTAYPDGKMAWLPVTDGMEEQAWLNSRRPDAKHLIATAYQLMGFPYLWGGTSVKGMDCSGFVKTCAFLNGLILTRDASQMAYTGQRYASTDYHDWKPGDLLFFGRPATEGKKARISHVGLYIGDGRFIHSMGYVHISSLNPEDKLYYDEFNKNRFLWTVNILDHIGTPGIQLIAKHPLYQPIITEH